MSSNFQVFDENATNMLSDSDYTSSTQRQNGVVPGIAPSALHNKLYFQVSTMAAAIAEALSDAGHTIADNDYSGIVDAIKATFVDTPLPPGWLSGPPPAYTNSNSVTIPAGVKARSSDDTLDIIVESDLIVSLAASGALGLDTGAEVGDTWYYLYLLGDSTGVNSPSAVWSATNEAASGSITMPAGYDKKRQLPFCVKNNASSDILPVKVASGWPYRPFIKYMLIGLGNQLTAATTSVLAASNGATTYTDVDCSSFIPPISTMGYFNTIFTRSVTATHYVRPDGSGVDEEGFVTANDSSVAQRSYFMPTSSSQVIEYKAGTANTFSGITVAGFVVTEV